MYIIYIYKIIMHNVSKTIMNPSYSWWLVWTHFWWNWGWFTISSLSFGRHSQNMGCVATNQGKFELMEKDCWVPGNRSGASGPIGPIYPVLSCLGFQKVIEYHSQPKLLVSTHQSPPVYSGVLLQQVEYSPQLLTEMHGVRACYCWFIWRCPKMGVPPTHPKFV